jgi:hypothetical protein
MMVWSWRSINSSHRAFGRAPGPLHGIEQLPEEELFEIINRRCLSSEKWLGEGFLSQFMLFPNGRIKSGLAASEAEGRWPPSELSGLEQYHIMYISSDSIW